jgi:methyltransferase-like protein
MTLTYDPAAQPETRNTYDEVPYPSHSFAQSHPDHLATLATLLGMNPPPVDRCRVLELGCASGGNLIPMAYGLPQSEFTGIDLSARQVAEGQTTLAALGLDNVTLKQMSIMAVEPDFGRFDYIIAHGVYSWVPPEVREKILTICRQNLAPEGVAYVSYNIYPGWHMLGSIRDMMLYHTRQITDANAQITQAREFLDFLVEWIPAQHGPFVELYQKWLAFVRDRMLPKEDAFLFHDELSVVNDPIYFHQFADQATRHGLRYLADAQFQAMLASNLPDEVADMLRRTAQDTIDVEQYIDFLHNRAFRQSLLCHQEVSLTARVRPDRLRQFHVASSALPESSEPDIQTVSVEKFLAPDGAVLTTDHPVTKAAMLHLIKRWPQTVSFTDLLAAARIRLNGAPAKSAGSPALDQDGLLLGANLLKAYGYSPNLVELHVHPPHFVTEITEFPVANPVVRRQAGQGHRVTNARHERLRLEGVTCKVLTRLDGSRNRTALLADLKQWVAEDVLEIQKDGQPVKATEEIDSVLVDMLDLKLRQIANAALLVG